MHDLELRIMQALAASTAQAPVCLADLPQTIGASAADITDACDALYALGMINRCISMRGSDSRCLVWATGVQRITPLGTLSGSLPGIMPPTSTTRHHRQGATMPTAQPDTTHPASAVPYRTKRQRGLDAICAAGGITSGDLAEIMECRREDVPKHLKRDILAGVITRTPVAGPSGMRWQHLYSMSPSTLPAQPDLPAATAQSTPPAQPEPPAPTAAQPVRHHQVEWMLLSDGSVGLPCGDEVLMLPGDRAALLARQIMALREVGGNASQVAGGNVVNIRDGAGVGQVAGGDIHNHITARW